LGEARHDGCGRQLGLAPPGDLDAPGLERLPPPLSEADGHPLDVHGEEVAQVLDLVARELASLPAPREVLEVMKAPRSAVPGVVARRRSAGRRG